MTLRSRPVIAFALLKQSGEAIHGDLLSGITILLRPLVADLSGKIFDSSQLASRIADQYGMDVPASVLEDLVPRLISANILYEEDSLGAKKVLYVDAEPQAQIVDPEEEARIQAILDAFLAHAKAQISGRHEFNDEELLSGFLRHLSTLDFHAVRVRPIVPPATSTLEGPSARSRREQSSELAADAILDIVVASYITDLQINHPADLEIVARIADGALAAELVLDLRAPTSVSKFQESIAVIDTPTLMSFLKLSAKPDQEAAEALFARLQGAGAKIAAFQHSIEEAEGILAAVQMAEHLGSSAYGPIKRRMQASANYKLYFDTVIGRVGHIWKETHHFEIIQSTANHYYTNFSTDNEERLFEQLRPTFGDNVPQGLRDAKSVAEIMRRLAKAHIPLDRVQTCRYFFVTGNRAFQGIASRFLRNNGFVGRGEFTPVATDRYIVGLCWLISGGSTNNAPSRVRLLANCATALRLRPEIVDRTKRFLNDLDPELVDHFEAVMTNDRASQYLMEASLGNPDAITASNVAEVFKHMQKRLTETVAREKDEFYGAKISQLQTEIDRGTMNQSQLQDQVAQLNLDKQASAVKAEEYEMEAKRLAEEGERQKTELATQSRALDSLSEKVAYFSDTERQLKEALGSQRRIAEATAARYADSWLAIFRYSEALIPIVLIGLISYFDKFILEELTEPQRHIGKWGFVGAQIVLGVVSAGSLLDSIFGKRKAAFRNRKYQERLKYLGYSDEALPKEATL